MVHCGLPTQLRCRGVHVKPDGDTHVCVFIAVYYVYDTDSESEIVLFAINYEA